MNVIELVINDIKDGICSTAKRYINLINEYSICSNDILPCDVPNGSIYKSLLKTNDDYLQLSMADLPRLTSSSIKGPTLLTIILLFPIQIIIDYIYLPKKRWIIKTSLINIDLLSSLGVQGGNIKTYDERKKLMVLKTGNHQEMKEVSNRFSKDSGGEEIVIPEHEFEALRLDMRLTITGTVKESNDDYKSLAAEVNLLKKRISKLEKVYGVIKKNTNFDQTRRASTSSSHPHIPQDILAKVKEIFGVDPTMLKAPFNCPTKVMGELHKNSGYEISKWKEFIEPNESLLKYAVKYKSKSKDNRVQQSTNSTATSTTIVISPPTTNDYEQK
ncbi:unnamed protein product [Rotaria sordida]|uniref:Uncharacterized protein n=3 Tax=Rotaria sordida TaxID=392033 RepID=A0A814SV98_9BILA|nr:unnamed protein product [Rotaria sordida]